MTLKVKSRWIGQISLALAVVLGVGQVTSQPTVAATLYSIIDLGNIGSYETIVTGINNLGQVVGSSRDTIPTPPYNVQLGFRTAPNSPINPATDNLGTSYAPYTDPRAINDLGQVVAEALAGVFRTDPNGLVDQSAGINYSYSRVALGDNINNLGQIVVGPGSNRFGNFVAYRTAPNSPVNPLTDDLGNLGGRSNILGNLVDFVVGRAINDLGQVVGTSLNTNSERHAFRTAPNRPINPATDDLGTLGESTSEAFDISILDTRGFTGTFDIFTGSTSDAIDINNLGQVVGYSTTASGEIHAFRTAPNSPINPATDDLGTLGGSTSSARAINNLGQVVGTSITASGERRAFLYDNNQMLDLNDLIPADLGVILNYAAGINDRGQIAAGSFGPRPNLGPRQNRIFLLTPIVSTPIPEPSSALGSLAIGVLSVGSVVWRKRQNNS